MASSTVTSVQESMLAHLEAGDRLLQTVYLSGRFQTHRKEEEREDGAGEKPTLPDTKGTASSPSTPSSPPCSLAAEGKSPAR